MNRKEHMENSVAQLVREGKTPNEAVAIAIEQFRALSENEPMEVCKEMKLEFSGDFSESGFSKIVQEEAPYDDTSLADLFKILGCQPGKRYEVEICVEEC
jgi:hypothetical protein